MVGGAEDQRVLDQAEVVQGVEDGADPLVERAGAGLEGGDVLAGGDDVGQVGRRQRVERVADRGRGEEVAVGLEEADRHEPGLRGGASRSASIVSGATYSARLESTGTISS